MPNFSDISSSPKSRIILVAVLGFIAVGIIGGLALSYANSILRALNVRTELTHEFAQITPTTSLKQVNTIDSFKPETVYFGAVYSSSQSPTNVFADNGTILESNGWVYHSINNVTVWGKPTGGQQAIYCKGEYAAILEF